MPGHGRRRRRRLVTQETEPRSVRLREYPCELQRSSANAPTVSRAGSACKIPTWRARCPRSGRVCSLRLASGTRVSSRYAWVRKSLVDWGAISTNYGHRPAAGSRDGVVRGAVASTPRTDGPDPARCRGTGALERTVRSGLGDWRLSPRRTESKVADCRAARGGRPDGRA